MKAIIGKTVLGVTAAFLIFGVGALVGAAKVSKPKTVLHVVAIKWRDAASEAEKKALLQSTEEMASKVPGIRNIWLKKLRVQPQGFTDAYAFEFDSEKALEAYAEHPARKEWLESYLKVRDASNSIQLTN